MTLPSRLHLWYWQQLGNLLALAERWYDEHSPVMRKRLLDEAGSFAFWDNDTDAIYDDDLPHYCGECHHELQLVRPGSYQCDYCDSKKVELEP